MDLFVKRFGSEEPPVKFADVDEEESVVAFKQRVSERMEIPVSQIRLIDDGDWGSLLLENGTLEDVSTNLVHLLVMEEDRTWDQFFFFVKPLEGPRLLFEADFLETVASAKSRLVAAGSDEAEIGLIYKWGQLADDMAFDDEVVDVAVGCTLDLFVREPGKTIVIFKSTCYKSFILPVDLSETTGQLKARIESQEGLLAADLVLMNLSGAQNGKLVEE